MVYMDVNRAKRHATVAVLLCAVFLPGGACTGPIVPVGESESDEDTTTGTSGETPTGSAEASTTSTTSATTSPPPVTTTTAPPDPTSSPSSSTTIDPSDTGSSGTTVSGPTGTDSDGGSDGGSCSPSMDDDECQTCLNEQCCEQLIQCDAEPDCRCLVDCVISMGLEELAACQELCNIVGIPASAIELQGCQGSRCPRAGC